ncbi:CO(2)-response secreted protease-like [Pistacia vera]|uniref:CO(2)-response secreted protease-like n=1 Tax=Pistacia vera TaxID=55513 RepID=UPI00126352D5|nr:CO(2)-response secreted protease-like [Pistacia vera]XP_031283141.1 CO(2)-response secreted protease-like [Pistacia vera]
MKGLTIVFFSVFCVLLFSFFVVTRADQTKNNGVYIVYMGAVASPSGSLRHEHAQLLASVSKRKQNALLYSYGHGFSGFAARLSSEEAHALSKKAGVVSVFPDPVLQLHTTRSWDFLKYQDDLLIDFNPTDSESPSQGSDTVIGILDTGIWPESESFNDKDMGPIPTRWNGTCAVGDDDKSFKCNKKIIGARAYEIEDDPGAAFHTKAPRDTYGHGTHVASTAAGRVVNASYYGLAAGSAKGGSPASRIAVYRVCSPDYGCTGSNILAAFDDAIADGVDVLSLSIGARAGVYLDFTNDPIALGAFHAVQHGITVVCSAGNDGPTSASVVNVAPWILTVAASTIDRVFESDIVLGGNKVIKGGGINFSDLKKSPVYPLIYAKSAKKMDADETEARNCGATTLNETLVKGKIVLCDNDNGMNSIEGKMDQVQTLGGVGAIVVDDESSVVVTTFGVSPVTVISSKDKEQIISYINSTRDPVATILPTVSVTEYKPAPVIAYFSARGPSFMTRNIIKPDIAAPGVNILAAWMGNDTTAAPKGKEPPEFNMISGTSMSCPHVSGIAATVKSQNPTWSPSAIKSAIMTTAIQLNNLKAPITTDSGSIATPYDIGAGEIGTTAPLQPGLIYETTEVDYLNFLCYYGYNVSKIKSIAKSVPEDFTCPKESSIDLISTINHPSIAISSFKGKEGRTVSRTLTNVAGANEKIYAVTVDAPQGLNVKVIPDKLPFTKSGQQLSYQVTFSSTLSSLKEDLFGSITWSNGKYKVRSPFAVSSENSRTVVTH